jgi:hypothetical protein
MLIAVLAPCTSTRVPLNAEVTLVPGDAWCVLWVNYGYSNGRSVNTSAPFGWWNALDSMSACFVYELGKIGAFYGNADTRVAVIGVLSESADSCEVLDVCVCQVFSKQL